MKTQVCRTILMLAFAAAAARVAIAEGLERSVDAELLPLVAPSPVSTSNAVEVGVAAPISPSTASVEIGRTYRLARLFPEAAQQFITVLLSEAPDEAKRTALIELAIVAHETNDLLRAQQILAQYITRWPHDVRVPEIMLRQGLIYRQMGLNALALTKFYAVMTSSLALKSDQLEQYQRLVLRAQIEIADTYYQQAKYAESVELYLRLLKSRSLLPNRSEVQARLVRALAALGRHEDVVMHAVDHLAAFSASPHAPEVRYYHAVALKELGRIDQSLQQVQSLLQPSTTNIPSSLAYWQQKTATIVANQLYSDGDFLHALEVYRALCAVDTNVSWQLPVKYQIGLTLERLEQSAQAIEQYTAIVGAAAHLLSRDCTNMRTVVEMAEWRRQVVSWQTNVHAAARALTPKPGLQAPP